MDEAVHAMEDCLADISTGMENNLLKLNQNKIELTVFSSKQVLTKQGTSPQGGFQLYRICKISKTSWHYLR